MRRTLTTLALVPVLLTACNEAPQTGTATANDTTTDQIREPTMTDHTRTSPVLEGLTMNRIDGSSETLGKVYAGKTLLIVNTASRCGLTPQYERLEALYREKKDDGLVILGFPANNFMGQEPGTNAEIAEFCSTNYQVTFPMFEKVSVKGGDTAELFARLTEATDEPSWNFTKYLVTPDGTITRFDPRTLPDDPDLVGAIDEALKGG